LSEFCSSPVLSA